MNGEVFVTVCRVEQIPIDDYRVLRRYSMALDAIKEGKHGLMTAIQNGCYALTKIPDSALGPRKVEIDIMYNKERYRPTYDRKAGMPIFLTHSGL